MRKVIEAIAWPAGYCGNGLIACDGVTTRSQWLTDTAAAGAACECSWTYPTDSCVVQTAWEKTPLTDHEIYRMPSCGHAKPNMGAYGNHADVVLATFYVSDDLGRPCHCLLQGRIRPNRDMDALTRRTGAFDARLHVCE